VKTKIPQLAPTMGKGPLSHAWVLMSMEVLSICRQQKLRFVESFSKPKGRFALHLQDLKTSSPSRCSILDA